MARGSVDGRWMRVIESMVSREMRLTVVIDGLGGAELRADVIPFRSPSLERNRSV